MKRSLHAIHSALVALVLAPLRLYSRFISPALPRRCKYEPTCSAYAQDAIRQLGVVRGSAAAGWRLLRCNPWSHGGWDPVSRRHPGIAQPQDPGLGQ
ncbi:MAG: membrane protein insertion efficiency factor YidD [Actinomycetota bacterium]|nr:membrane protein insertion efficiency factor YidD [Actinomycetota bacterium]